MTDRDDILSSHYRELAREEPPAALDARVLSAAREAARPGARGRWIRPVSIAAVLVLGLGVALRMQVEEPGIEHAAPSVAAPAVPEAAQAPPAGATPAQSEPAARAAPRALGASPAPGKARGPRATEDHAMRQADTALARESAMPAEKPAGPPPVRLRTEAFAPSPSPAPPPPQAAIPAAPAPAQAAQHRATADPRREALERIARLRADGRDDEADKALAEFRREHPAYAIEPALWERVRPRQAR